MMTHTATHTLLPVNCHVVSFLPYRWNRDAIMQLDSGRALTGRLAS